MFPDDKKDSGEVLIHFDGWTSKYDYWTMPDSKDLHPIGFMAQKARDHSDWTPDLQAPKGQGVTDDLFKVMRVNADSFVQSCDVS